MRGEKIPTSLIIECVDQYPHTAPEIADMIGVSAQVVRTRLLTLAKNKDCKILARTVGGQWIFWKVE